VDISSAEFAEGSENGNGVGLQPRASSELLRALDRLQESFDSKIRYDETRDRQIAELHEELQKHRQGLYGQIIGPLLNDLISLHDEVSKIIATTKLAHADDGDFAFLLSAIEEILARYRVLSFYCEGESVERTRQKVIEVLPADERELDRRIARRVRPGFELDGKILRPEWVVAYCFTPTED